MKCYLRESLQVVIGLAVLMGLILAAGDPVTPTWALSPCGVWPIVMMGIGAHGLYKLSRSRIEIGEQGLNAHFHGANTSVVWSDITYARKIGQFLEIWTGQEPQLIDLTQFDIDMVWREIEKSALPHSLADSGASNIEILQKQLGKYELLSKPDSHSILFRHWQGSTLMWLCIPLAFLILHLIFWAGASLATSLYLLVVTLPIGVFSILMAWNRSLRFEVSTTKVSLSNRFFTRELLWEEVQEFTASRGSYSLIFTGKGKRLVAPGIREWRNKADDIFDILCANLWRHQIKINDLSRTYPHFQLAVLPKSIQR